MAGVRYAGIATHQGTLRLPAGTVLWRNGVPLPAPQQGRGYVYANRGLGEWYTVQPVGPGRWTVATWVGGSCPC